MLDQFTQTATRREIEDRILDLLGKTKIGSENRVYAGKELFGALEAFSFVRGGTHEEQVNRAAIMLIRGDEPFLSAMREVHDADAGCPAWVTVKLMALAVIACECGANPEDLLIPLQDGGHEKHVWGLGRERSENLADREAHMFMLGAAYRTSDEDREDTDPLRREAWNLSEGNDRLRGWYWVFFTYPPFPEFTGLQG